MVVVLIGLRCSGKSTYGPRLARALTTQTGQSWNFADLDTRVARSLDAQGEAAFRAAEALQLGAALRESNLVLATGGGTPTAPGAADALRDARARGACVVVYLHGPPGELQQRMRSAKSLRDRPALRGNDPIAEVPALYAARDPLYRTLADEIVPIGASPGVPARELSERLAMKWSTA